MGEDPVCGQLIRAYEEEGLSVLGIKEVPKADISKYSSLDVTPVSGNLYKVTDMIEKPAPGEEKSLFSILGRCVLTPDVFAILENLGPGAGGEIQLTDALKVLARKKKMMGVDFVGKRYEMGNKLGILSAICETALSHPETGTDFRAYLQALAKSL